MTSTAQGRASRTRGHTAERRVAAHLRDHGFPDAATSRSALGHDGTRQAGDLVDVPGLCIDVKDVAGSAWPTWLRQARAEAEPAGLVPVVVRRTRGNPDVGEWVAVADWDWVPLSCRIRVGSTRSMAALLAMGDDRWCANESDGGQACPAMVDLGGGWIAMRFSDVVASAKGMAP